MSHERLGDDCYQDPENRMLAMDIAYFAYRQQQGKDEARRLAAGPVNKSDFEDLDYEHLTDYRALYDHINARLLPDRMNYVFLDEIQRVGQFEKAADSLFIKKTLTCT
jgi:hypothetical protein